VQQWRLLRSGNRMYEMRSDNLVEGMFGWLKEERSLGSAYFFTKAIFLKYVGMQASLYKTAEAVQMNDITPKARQIFDTNMLSITIESHTVQVHARNPPKGVVTTALGHSSRQKSYNVDYLLKVRLHLYPAYPFYIPWVWFSYPGYGFHTQGMFFIPWVCST
jgi:hypothetical protein